MTIRGKRRVRMLVLTRKVNESILIGRDIEIRVTRIQGDSVRIAISAPRGVEILRKEILDEVTKENQVAARAGGEELLIFLSGATAKLPEEPE